MHMNLGVFFFIKLAVRPLELSSFVTITFKNYHLMEIHLSISFFQRHIIFIMFIYLSSEFFYFSNLILHAKHNTCHYFELSNQVVHHVIERFKNISLGIQVKNNLLHN